ncbi:MAG: extensin family protein [Bdellovibrionales bacterium]|nr:extensin family protein [Bdellovibrionales bacterium]NQZ19226.1 extensin family protein [Bdellovibrionales bacterium]
MQFKLSFIIFCLFAVTACNPLTSELQSLGSNSDFSDVEIQDDFMDPEEEDIESIENIEVINEVEPEQIVIQMKNTFDMGTRLFSLANGNAYRWEGCNKDKASQGGYNSNTNCGRGFFHPSFADNLNDVFYQCISEAASEAGYPQPVYVFINHLGTYNDRNARNSSRKSNHAFARAWDIKYFNLYDKDGNGYRISTYRRDYKGQQAEFYDEFRDCWKDSLPANCSPGKTEYKGSIGHTASKLGGNSLHNDHIHLSYPVCAG